MRRRDREVTCTEEIINIIDSCKVCRIAMQDSEGLYIVPMNFGYEYSDGKLRLYMHSAKAGRKIDALTKNPEICFEMDCGHRLIRGEDACSWGYAFKSVIGRGMASFADGSEAVKGLTLLMKHQTGKDFSFTHNMAEAVTVLKIEVLSFTGKSRNDF